MGLYPYRDVAEHGLPLDDFRLPDGESGDRCSLYHTESDMMPIEPTVFVVDDDAVVRRSLMRIIRAAGLSVEPFATAEEFLSQYDPAAPGCLVADLRMPGISGLMLQEQLQARGIQLPFIIVTGYGDVPQAVQAMKHGAVDFLQKPFDNQVLLDRIRKAIEQDTRLRQGKVLRARVKARLATLTSRERQVMDMVVTGLANKEIAARLSLSSKTVEAHRARVMKKTRAASLAELVRLGQADKQQEDKALFHTI